MKTVLIPTDFSKNSIKALECAFDFFNGNYKYVLCHVYDIPKGGTSSLFFLLEELRKQAEKDMTNLMETLEKEYPLKYSSIESRISQGEFTHQIKLLTKEYDAHCIVMGTKGASGVLENVIGSNAARLVGNSETQVLTVPENYSKSKIEDLVLCYDGKEVSKELALQIHDFSVANQLPIKLFHVRTAKQAPIQNWGEIEELVEDPHTSLHEEYGENFESGLKNRFEQFDSILVLIRRKRPFWEKLFIGSHSKKVVSHINLPVLILPE